MVVRSSASRPGSTCSSRSSSPISSGRLRTPPGRLTPVAVPKIVGIETEYGVALRGAPDPNPVVASSPPDQRVRRAAPRRLGLRGRVARLATPAASPRDGSQPPEVETHLVNTVLTNGARYYVDHAHPEYSTPECGDPLEVVAVRQGGGADPRPLDGGGPAPAAAGPGDRRLQEQQRRQGQLLRLPRELPRRPQRAVRGARAQPDPVVRHPAGVHRRGQGRLRERRRARRLSRSASAPTSSRRRSGSRRR